MEVIILFIMTLVILPTLFLHIEIGMYTFPVAIFFAFMSHYYNTKEEQGPRVACIIFAVILVIFSVTVGTYSLSELFNMFVKMLFH